MAWKDYRHSQKEHLGLGSDSVGRPSGSLFIWTQSRTNRVLTMMTGVLAEMPNIPQIARTVMVSVEILFNEREFALLLCTKGVNLGPEEF